MGVQMSLSSRLVFPVIIGGFVALFGSGIFTPPVMALAHGATEMAVVTGVSQTGEMHLHKSPAIGTEAVATVATATWVWIEHCTQAQDQSNWCLVERGAAKGWIDATHLALR